MRYMKRTSSLSFLGIICILSIHASTVKATEDIASAPCDKTISEKNLKKYFGSDETVGGTHQLNLAKEETLAGGYKLFCFETTPYNYTALSGTTLSIHNTTAVPVIIDGLTLAREQVAITKPFIHLTGSGPIILRNITITGADDPAAIGIQVDAPKSMILDTVITGLKRGIVISAHGTTVEDTGLVRNTHMDGSVGIQILSGNKTTLTDNAISGFEICAELPGHGQQFTQGSCTGLANADGPQMQVGLYTNGTQVTFHDNIIENAIYGILIDPLGFVTLTKNSIINTMHGVHFLKNDAAKGSVTTSMNVMTETLTPFVTENPTPAAMEKILLKTTCVESAEDGACLDVANNSVQSVDALLPTALCNQTFNAIQLYLIEQNELAPSQVAATPLGDCPRQTLTNDYTFTPKVGDPVTVTPETYCMARCADDTDGNPFGLALTTAVQLYASGDFGITPLATTPPQLASLSLITITKSQKAEVTTVPETAQEPIITPDSVVAMTETEPASGSLDAGDAHVGANTIPMGIPDLPLGTPGMEPPTTADAKRDGSSAGGAFVDVAGAAASDAASGGVVQSGTPAPAASCTLILQ
jgi:hypothetical protein